MGLYIYQEIYQRAGEKEITTCRRKHIYLDEEYL